MMETDFTLGTKFSFKFTLKLVASFRRGLLNTNIIYHVSILDVSIGITVVNSSRMFKEKLQANGLINIRNKI